MNDYIRNVCKIGQGAECCKYLLLASTGFECAKVNPLDKTTVDKVWATTEHVAQGDNCEGKEDLNGES